MSDTNTAQQAPEPELSVDLHLPISVVNAVLAGLAELPLKYSKSADELIRRQTVGSLAIQKAAAQVALAAANAPAAEVAAAAPAEVAPKAEPAPAAIVPAEPLPGEQPA